MIENRDIIVFSSVWNRFPSTVQHIGEVLAKRNRILWVSGLGLRAPKLQLNDFRRIAENIAKLFKHRYGSESNVPVIEVHPLVLPFYDNSIMRNFNKRHIRTVLLKKMKDLNFRDPVLFPSNPLVSDIVGTLGESSSHYLCVDDYSHFVGTFKSLPAIEKEILNKVDSVFSVADLLVRSRIPKSGRSYFLPQGVDVNHFKPAETPAPPDIASIKKPIVGFFGLVASWIDLKLIVKCAEKYPDYSFVIIGRPLVDTSIFSSAPNIKFLGEKPYQQLPRYAQEFNVGIIPFIINELTLASNPLKLLEYYSMGIPVVSTDLPEVRKFKDLVFISENDDQFIDFIGTALKDNLPERNAKRRKESERYSWESIVERISSVIETIELQKQSPNASLSTSQFA